jgi:hypothetical protein
MLLSEGETMTEQEWLNEKAHPQSLWMDFSRMSIMRTKVGRRKLRLFGCGCCRLIWPQIYDARLRKAVEVAERFADGQATASELERAGKSAKIIKGSRGYSEEDPNAQTNTVEALVVATTGKSPNSTAAAMSLYPLPLAGYRGEPKQANALICDLLRDIFGNPFRPIAFSPEWRTDTAIALARTMYDSREFSAMPILADALQDAGCDNTDILNHCRDAKQTHVRGCWVVDLVLGKS